MSVVPNGMWQRKNLATERDRFKPGSGEKHYVTGRLLEVWDQERQNTQVVPDSLQFKLQTSPGILYGLVAIGHSSYYLQFKDTEDLVYLIHGNAPQLEGRTVKIEFTNTNIGSGKILLEKIFNEKHVNLISDLQILDIGGII